MTTPTATRLTCVHQRETWGPHPGCAEWMTEPEVWPPCGAPATEIHIVTGPAPGPIFETEAGRWFDAPDTEVSVAAYCADCAEEARATYISDPYIQSIRINPASKEQ